MSDNIIRITPPMDSGFAQELKAGDEVLITGTIYTARDAAHKLLCEDLKAGKDLPFDLKGAIIYYVGPTPGSPEQAVGAAGPTTSYRMDAYAPVLIQDGLSGMIGKGARDEKVIAAMKKHGAVYFAAIGGAGALLAKCIKEAEVIAYDHLGPEAIRRLYVEDFPAIVATDSTGNSLYK